MTGCFNHQAITSLLVGQSLQHLQEATMGSTASQLGSSAKNLALAMAVTPPKGMTGSEAQLLSLRSAMFEAANAAARAAILQHLKAPVASGGTPWISNWEGVDRQLLCCGPVLCKKV